MSDDGWRGDEFEAHRAHMKAVAYRMLGSAGDADDAVQEAWIRFNRSDATTIDNLGGWLTTVVARISLDMLRSRSTRPEPRPVDERASGEDPEADAVLADSVGAALLVVLDTLSPAERLAFVLHDTFAVPFEEIGLALGRSADAAKQLASRARRKVQGGEATQTADRARQRELIDAFVTASRQGDFESLVSLLAPDVVLHADSGAVFIGAPERLDGAAAVAGMFSGRAQAARATAIDGGVGLVWIVGGVPKVVWDFATDGDRITHIEMLAEPSTLEGVELVVFSA